MSELVITEANFESEVANSNIPVFLDFWAPWCGPCRTIGPMVEELAKDYAGKIKVGKVNVDAEGDLASRFGVVSIPCLVVINNGEEYAKKVGAIPKRDMEAMFKPLL